MRKFGYFINDDSECGGDVILLVLTSPRHISMYESLWKETDRKFMVFCPLLDQSAMIELASQYGGFKVKFTNDTHHVIFNADFFCLVITSFDIAMSINFPVLPVLYHMKKLGIPLGGIQHGLFQWGLSFADESKFYSKTVFSDPVPQGGAGYPIKLFWDFSLKWFGKNAIGYPRFTKNYLAESQQLIDCDFAFILTNLNFHIYSHGEVFRFYSAIRKLISANPQQMFYWRPHPAELGMAFKKFAHRFLRKIDNLKILGTEFDGHSLTNESTERLIARCKNLISMPSTVLLDAEIFNKPVLVYQCEGNRRMIEAMGEKAVFCNESQLVEKYARMLDEPKSAAIKTNMLKQFDPQTLLKFIDENKLSKPVEKSDILLACADTFSFIKAIEHLQPAASPAVHAQKGTVDTTSYVNHQKNTIGFKLLKRAHRIYLRLKLPKGYRNSELFDSKWYLETYPDIALAGEDPLVHYYVKGWREGRNPSANFNTDIYLVQNPDVLDSGINPLEHYEKHGKKEGRRGKLQ